MTTGEAIRAVRTKIGKSQQVFSNDMRVTVTTVSRWETDKVTPEPMTLAALFRMARDLDMSDAAAAIASESFSLFDLLGPRMIQHAEERFGQIAGRILELRHVMREAGAEKAIPDDMWASLGHAVTLCSAGKDDMKQLSAMLPHVELKQ
jgi:transcriptional regulator with XRE-family HTH domain